MALYFAKRIKNVSRPSRLWVEFKTQEPESLSTTALNRDELRFRKRLCAKFQRLYRPAALRASTWSTPLHSCFLESSWWSARGCWTSAAAMSWTCSAFTLSAWPPVPSRYLLRCSYFGKCFVKIARRLTPLSVSAFHGADQGAR